MAVLDLYLAISGGVTGVQEVSLREAMTQPSVQIQILCTAHTLNIGGTIASVDMGFATNHAVVMSNGIVKRIQYNRPSGVYTITLQDPLIRAVDNFMASDDPAKPFQASNISGEFLVRDLLANSGLNSYTYDASGDTFATVEPKPINLITAWDAINNVAKIAGFTVYCDNSGVVHFSNRKPYIVGGDASTYSIKNGNGNTLMISDYAESDEALRNRVVVYGANGLHSTASASSPYLPAGFYKALVVGHELIDSQAQADLAGTVNLTFFNRLTSTCNATVVGDPSLRARKIVDVTDGKSLTSSLFIVNGSTHRLSDQGYQVELTLTR